MLQQVGRHHVTHQPTVHSDYTNQSSHHSSFSGPWMWKMSNMSGTGHRIDVTGRAMEVM